MISALCHDFGKTVTTAAGEDGRIHALGHETEGLPIAEAFIRRLTGNRKLRDYVLNMIKLHMKPNIVAGALAKPKSTNKMFDESVDPEGLILLGRADHLGRTGAEINREYEAFLWERLQNYRSIMARPYVQGKDLIEAGLKPGQEFSQILAYAHKLRLAGVGKESAMKQTLAYARKCGS
jgi:tRNA nucleotidyltransferase (CCA-adding enzyme)